jgi:hypothetical protein
MGALWLVAKHAALPTYRFRHFRTHQEPASFDVLLSAHVQIP